MNSNNIAKNWKQKWEMLTIGYRFMKLVQAPYGDFTGIEQLSNVLNTPSSFKQIMEFISRSEQGKRALQERPRLGKVDLQQLHQLPENTLGYIYANHMIKNGFTPPSTPEAVDGKSYPGAHLLETHDIWHVVTGCDTTKAGEIKLEAFYVAQIYPSPLFLALLAKNLMKTALEDIELCEEHMNALVQGWMLGKQANSLFGIQWNTQWETPLENLRNQFNLNQQMSKTLEAV
jgi:ubiquinone biosynthesis protein COQ4